MFPNVDKGLIVSKLQETGTPDETPNWLLSTTSMFHISVFKTNVY